MGQDQLRAIVPGGIRRLVNWDRAVQLWHAGHANVYIYVVEAEGMS
jgi:hypothetical protein